MQIDESVTLGEVFKRTETGGTFVGETADGRLISIRQAPSGLACGCVCPGCRRPLVARKGEVRTHHFAHHSLVDDKPCIIAGETVLHRLAKEILGRRLTLKLPGLVFRDHGDSEEVVKPGRFFFDRAELELRVGEVVPDVVLYRGGRRLFVEFKVTHACGTEKIARIQKMDVGAVEIELEGFRDVKLRDLEQIILFKAPREWLHNPKTVDAVGRLSARVAERARRRAELIAHLRSLYVHVYPTGGRGSGEHELAARRDNYATLLNHDVPGTGSFSVPVAEWQGKVVCDLVSGRRLNVSDLLTGLESAGMIKPELRRVSWDDVKMVAEIDPQFGSPGCAVFRYLLHLSEIGMAHSNDDGWKGTDDFARRREFAVRTRELAGHRLVEVAHIIAPLLHDAAGGGPAGFVFSEWAKREIDGLGAPLTVAHCDSIRWTGFRNALKAITGSGDDPDATREALGLPLAGASHEMRRRMAPGF